MTATETLRLPAPPAQPEPVEAPAYDVDPGEREPDHTRPVDADTCPSCEGQCLVEIRSWMTGDMVWINCRACGGTGERSAA